MYKLVLAGVSALFMAAAACAQPNQTMNSTQPNSRILVACFSATGTTARIAEKVAAATGGTLYAITPAEPYTSADLDWTDKRSRSSREMNDPKARPEIGGEKIDVVRYSERPEEYVAAALSPATVLGVTYDGERTCTVKVAPDQLSLAIGKEGQNAKLAAKLTGMRIDIKAS